MIPLYSPAGTAVAFADDACHLLYHPDGRVAAWLDDGLLYTPQGRYLGWVHHGWILDRSGRAALFAENAAGKPTRPAVSAPPPGFWPRPGQVPRRLTRRGNRPARRGRVAEWSEYAGANYFKQ
ncbi:hypothetical protein LJ737_17555 [Hymenobacter sp. 15J16-1T3B]|uniref:4-fold beta flower protein n=1 Tax=Hymenobacter sp. 15J16-1T3B TaxID=2886941 RepID=UPI001D129DCD|nr:hypothetical protein [Hymenobacter sp. 15J16-1T3B]MCC3159053.1 hypothetical protein [Hymenobacter sp. 15J16-1T3B]